MSPLEVSEKLAEARGLAQCARCQPDVDAARVLWEASVATLEDVIAELLS